MPVTDTQIKALIPPENDPYNLPFDIETLLMKDRRSKASSRVATLVQIEELESALAIAKGSLEDLNTTLKSYSLLFDPLHSVPPELLHKVFETCDPAETSVWILSSVSKKWRAATMADDGSPFFVGENQHQFGSYE